MKVYKASRALSPFRIHQASKLSYHPTPQRVYHHKPPAADRAMGDPRAEAALLTHYRLQNPFPETWSDPIEEAQIIQRQQSRASTSRYSILQEEGIAASLRGLVGGDVYSTGVVPEDEPDPLGIANSVVRVLKKRGLPVKDNVR